MSTPAPSPMMKPSRSRSNGRLARAGSSLRVDSARIAAKPPSPIGVIAASEPPAIIASAAPRRIISKASPMACAEAEQAVQVAEFGPLGAEPDRDLPGGQVDDGRGNEERRDAARPALEIRLVLALDGAEAADARGDEHADARRDRRA